jgi:hypothetical protein
MMTEWNLWILGNAKVIIIAATINETSELIST